MKCNHKACRNDGYGNAAWTADCDKPVNTYHPECGQCADHCMFQDPNVEVK